VGSSVRRKPIPWRTTIPRSSMKARIWLMMPVRLLYVVLTHPTVIGSAVGWVAEQLGLNGPVCIFFAYLLAFRMLYWFLHPLFWCIWQPFRLAIRAFSRRQSASGATPS
jgi:hypothetical protein